MSNTDELVQQVLETCGGYEYYHEAYYGVDPPFHDLRPDPAAVAEALQELCRLVPRTIRTLKSDQQLLAVRVAELECIVFCIYMEHHVSELPELSAATRIAWEAGQRVFDDRAAFRLKSQQVRDAEARP